MHACLRFRNPEIYRFVRSPPARGYPTTGCGIYQDATGYIWFSTAEGLNRFDGYEIKVFRLTDPGGQCLGDIHFNAVRKKNDRELWVCTDMGVYTFDFYKQEKFCQPLLEKTSIICMAKDPDGHVWFGTISSNNIIAIHEDRRGNLKKTIPENF